MTPSQEAKHLFNLFYMELLQADSDVSEEIVISNLSKKCAMICCDEIDRCLQLADIAYGNMPAIERIRKVKSKIEKL